MFSLQNTSREKKISKANEKPLFSYHPKVMLLTFLDPSSFYEYVYIFYQKKILPYMFFHKLLLSSYGEHFCIIKYSII